MSALPVEIEVRCEGLERAVSEALQLIKAQPSPLRFKLVKLFEGIRRDGDLFTTGQADALTICLEPSDRLAEFLAALRAGDFDRMLVEQSHNTPPVAVPAPATVQPREAASNGGLPLGGAA